MEKKTPLAFLSYAHLDDEHERGKLRRFAERLRGEVRLHSGEDFPIFVDRDDVKWGQEWKARIEESLGDTTFLIPILTPGYFRSEWCRREFFRFQERERALNRRDLILAVYYVGCPLLEDPAKRAQDELARMLHDRQYKDCRNLRHMPWTKTDVKKQFEQMALEVVAALERTTRNRQLDRLLFIITAQKQSGGGRLLLVTNNNLGWRVKSESAETSRPDTAYLLPYLEDANFDDRAGAGDLAYAVGLDPAAVEVTIDPLVFRSTKHNPVFKCDTEYSFRFARVRLIHSVAALQVSRPELSLRPHQFEWHSLQFLMAHKPTLELNFDVLEEVAKRFGNDLQGTLLSVEEPVPVESDA